MKEKSKPRTKIWIVPTEKEEQMLMDLIVADDYVYYKDALRFCIRNWHNYRFSDQYKYDKNQKESS